MSSQQLTDAIGIHAVFGAFVIGVAMPRGLVTKEFSRQVEPLASTLFGWAWRHSEQVLDVTAPMAAQRVKK